MTCQECAIVKQLRDKLDEAEERERQLREALLARPDQLTQYRVAFKLYPQEAQMLTLLMEMSEVSHDALLVSIPAVRRNGDHRDDMNALKTNKCNLNKKLAPHGATVEAIRGWGYWMSKESKDAVRRRMK